MSRASDILTAAVVELLAFQNVTPAAAAVNLAINAAGAATVKTNAAIQYTNNGVIKYKAALAAQSIAPTVGVAYPLPAGANPATGATYQCYFTIGLDAAGAVVVVQGSYAGQKLSLDPTKGLGSSQAGSSWVGDGSIPDVPDGVTPIGVLKVVNATNAFTPGTTLLDAAGVTVSYFDVAILPSGNL